MIITEMIDGLAVRYQWTAGKTWAGTLDEWIPEPEMDSLDKHACWEILHEDDRIRTAVWRLRPLVIHGVVYQTGSFRFRAEDMYNPARNRWLDWHDFSDLWRGALEASRVDWTEALQYFAAPVVYVGKYDPDLVDELVEQPSRVATFDVGEEWPMKGVIVRPVAERFIYDLDASRVWGSQLSEAYRIGS